MRQRIKVPCVVAGVLTALSLPVLAAASATPLSAPVPSIIASAGAEPSPDYNNTLVVTQMPEGGINLRDFAPGDRTQWATEVTNTGASGTVTIDFFADGDDSLVNGEGTALQMTVDLCERALIPVVSAVGATTFDCPAEPSRLGRITSARDEHLTADHSIKAGETLAVRVKILFPTAADNSAQNTGAALDVRFSITPDDPNAQPVPQPAFNPTPPVPVEARTPPPFTLGGLALTGTNILWLLCAAVVIISLGITAWTLSPRRSLEEQEESP